MRFGRYLWGSVSSLSFLIYMISIKVHISPTVSRYSHPSWKALRCLVVWAEKLIGITILRGSALKGNYRKHWINYYSANIHITTFFFFQLAANVSFSFQCAANIPLFFGSSSQQIFLCPRPAFPMPLHSVKISIYWFWWPTQLRNDLKFWVFHPVEQRYRFSLLALAVNKQMKADGVG